MKMRLFFIELKNILIKRCIVYKYPYEYEYEYNVLSSLHVLIQSRI